MKPTEPGPQLKTVNLVPRNDVRANTDPTGTESQNMNPHFNCDQLVLFAQTEPAESSEPNLQWHHLTTWGQCHTNQTKYKLRTAAQLRR